MTALSCNHFQQYEVLKMTVFYNVAYSENGRIKFKDFDFFNDVLEFINKIRQSGERATLRKIPSKEWGE